MIKKSFAELVQEEEAGKHNSDLRNLAAALAYAQEAVLEAKALVLEIEETAAAIEAGKVFPVGVISALYNKSRQSTTFAR
jgi:ATP-dependent protease HslVU (ClpYQ) peptidase subunit